MSPAAEKALARRCAKYAITPEQYLKTLVRQRGRCGVCEKPFTRTPNIDHDHRTERARGLLCFPCNKFVVGRHHDGKLLRAAADYLDSDFDMRKL